MGALGSQEQAATRSSRCDAAERPSQEQIRCGGGTAMESEGFSGVGRKGGDNEMKPRESVQNGDQNGSRH